MTHQQMWTLGIILIILVLGTAGITTYSAIQQKQLEIEQAKILAEKEVETEKIKVDKESVIEGARTARTTERWTILNPKSWGWSTKDEVKEETQNVD